MAVGDPTCPKCGFYYAHTYDIMNGHHVCVIVNKSDNKDDTVATKIEPIPHGKGPNIHDLLKVDIEERAILGENRYGEKLKPFNGREVLVDAYQEALDLSVYLRQLIYEKYGE